MVKSTAETQTSPQPQAEACGPVSGGDQYANDAVHLLSATGLETKGILFAVFDEGDLLTGRDVTDFIDVLTEDDPSVFSAAYWGELCKQGVKIGTFTQSKGTSATFDPHRYALTDYGYDVARPFSGHLLEWSLEHDISLREFLGEPRTLRPTESSRLLGKIGLLKAATQGTMSAGEALEFAKTHIVAKIDGASTAVKEIKSLPYVAVGEGGSISVRDEYSAAVINFAGLLEAAEHPDNSFTKDGHEKLEAIINDPVTIKQLEKRAADSSRKQPGKRLDYGTYMPTVAQHVQRDGLLNIDSIRRMFPDLKTDQISRLRRHIRKHAGTWGLELDGGNLKSTAGHEI